ncbi:TerB family tellurite resistance protein [Acanthopleuribacter pedis]|uniref:TerB family tellurite resistance protein n=1 Tax=Acanthopleuribacter pedis TaxID=442870 RepID=A0A8J7U247_9BACT|nr:TerB family tellurite resistance protein [Acanthopleuribacter pedis]MBO1318227.1 TerB family tellurite resistance protein [Acanthopleuribacter pedis]
MQQANYENVLPLLASKEIDDSRVDCVFRCPVSGDTYSAAGNMVRSAEIQSNAASSVKRGIKNELSYAMGRIMRGMFGYNPLSNMAARAAGDAIRNVKTHAAYTEEDQQQAVVQAFNKVSHKFAWDAKKHAWVSASALQETQTEFEKKLARASFNNRFDSEVMARILVEMSQVDGAMSDEEKDMLADFLPPDLSLNSLLAQPPLSQAELMETGAGPVRENMLMLAWAMLFADYEVDPAEVAFLEKLANHMKISDGQANTLKNLALEFIVMQLFEQIGAGSMSRDEVFGKAVAMGMDRLQAERLEVRFRKARG